MSTVAAWLVFLAGCDEEKSGTSEQTRDAGRGPVTTPSSSIESPTVTPSTSSTTPTVEPTNTAKPSDTSKPRDTSKPESEEELEDAGAPRTEGGALELPAPDGGGDAAPASTSKPASPAPMETSAPVSTAPKPTPAPAIAWTFRGLTEEGIGIESATIEVPVDYENPKGPTLEISMVRARTEREDRDGVMMYNPGGPGPGTLADAEYLIPELTALFPTMDIVLVDNRGTGLSSPIDCVSLDDLGPAEDDDVPSDGQGGDAEGLLLQVRDAVLALAELCQLEHGDTLRYFNSENVARDMDYIRAALGEKKLNYWGISYGTVQGALYAELFPERVRAFVLDSPVLRTPNGPDWIDQVVQSVEEYERQLERFFSWAARDPAFAQGPAVRSMEEIYDGLVAQLAAGVEFEGETVSSGMLSSVTQTLLRAGLWDILGQVLAMADQGDWSPIVTLSNGDGLGAESEPAFRALQANVMLNMMEFGCREGFGIDEALVLYEDLSASHPRFGAELGAGIAQCIDWELEPSEPRVVAKDLKSDPLLVLAGLNDPATPFADAVTLVDQFANGSRLLSSSAEGHGVGGINDCGALIQFALDADVDAAPSACAPAKVASVNAVRSQALRRLDAVTARKPHRAILGY